MYINKNMNITIPFWRNLLLLVTIALIPADVNAKESKSNINIEVNKGNKYLLNKEDSWYLLRMNYERGFLGVLNHTIQFGKNGSVFDYVSEGGQNILFPFKRYTAEVELNNTHVLTFLIQPFDLKTDALLDREIIVDSLVFPERTSMDLRYYFTFYRLSYLYDFKKELNRELAFGLSFQIRNASIVFSSSDGSLLRVNNNIGPVPILKFRWRHPFENGLWMGSEIDGFYASGKYITGSTNDFEGAILDASIRMGFNLKENLDAYLNIRYIGGGASGTSDADIGPGDGYTDNWLKTLSISLGFYLM